MRVAHHTSPFQRTAQGILVGPGQCVSGAGCIWAPLSIASSAWKGRFLRMDYKEGEGL